METGTKLSESLTECEQFRIAYEDHVAEITAVFRLQSKGILSDNEIIRSCIEATNCLVSRLKIIKERNAKTTNV